MTMTSRHAPCGGPVEGLLYALWRSNRSESPYHRVDMTAFVESCVGTVADSAVAVERRHRGRPKARHLLSALAGKKNILLTTHLHPDPDALGSAMALRALLEQKLDSKDGKDAKTDARPQITLSIKGTIGGGLNDAFVRNSNLKLAPWDDATLASYDAIVLLDTQPQFSFSPLPAGVKPTAVIDHHRGKPGRRPDCPFCDIRTDAGSTSSIVFSYFMELEVPIKPDLAATLLYAIESDLAGAAGTPGELDNIALSSLTLLADPRRLYQMRYVDLPQSYYVCYSQALQNAVYLDNALISHLDKVESLEQPAIMADFLLRFDKVIWVLVTATAENTLVMSLRTSSKERSAADVMRRIIRKVGEGGGHKTKAGGFIDISKCTPAEVENYRKLLWRRMLRALGIKAAKGQRLVPR